MINMMTINLNILFRNLQQLLTRRLQGVAYFLDKLLSHKYVLFFIDMGCGISHHYATEN